MTKILLSLLIVLSIGLSRCGQMEKLIDVARTRWCADQSTLDKTCMKSIIKGYFSLYDLCSGGYSKCDLCADQINYITTKIPLITKEYTVADFTDVAVAMSISVTERNFACSAVNNGSIKGYLNEALRNDELNHGAEDWIEHVYGKATNRLDTSSFDKCVAFQEILSKNGSSSSTKATLFVKPILREMVLHQISGYLMSHHCSQLPPPQLILNDLYRFMGLHSSTDLVMESNLQIIMRSLKIGVIIKPNNHPHHEGHSHDHEGHSHDHEDHSHDHEDHSHDHESHSHDHEGHSPDHDNKGHDHNEIENNHEKVKDDLSKLIRRRRSTEQPIVNNLDFQCLSLDNIYVMYNYDKKQGLNHKQFLDIIPILLQQSISNSCRPKPVKLVVKATTIAERYGWGTLSVAIICLCSVFGLVLVPLGSKHYFQMFIVFFVALGVGTLVGDAVLHLIPEAMGFHTHDPKVIWKLVGSLVSLLLMFVMENMLSLYKKKKESPETNHDTCRTHEDHSHMRNFDHLKQSTVLCDENNGKTMRMEGPKAPLSAAIMVILGDSIHNFADGLALGAAFTSSVQKGISTSIAIFCHELPHEFGDFAILLASGFKWKWALLANLLSSLTAFAGLYVGLVLSSESPMTQQIIFAITSGMFLYVALTDMLPSLIAVSKTSNAKMFILEVVGIALGMSTMILLSFYEESIQI